MMPGESEGLKGCASRTGEEPALALDPLALARRLAHMPFRSGQVRGRRVSFLLCPRSDISNLHRHWARPWPRLPAFGWGSARRAAW